MSLSCPKPFREDTYPTKIQATPHSSLSHHLNRRERDSQKGVLSLLICSILSQESWADREGIYPLIRFCSQQQEGFSWGWAGPWWPLPPHICHSTWPNDYQVSPGSFLFFDLFSGLVLFFFITFSFGLHFHDSSLGGCIVPPLQLRKLRHRDITFLKVTLFGRGTAGI